MADVQRYGMVLRIRPDKIEEYKRYHADIWTGVADIIRACHIQKYSIYLKDDFLFSYFEYTGDDFKGDMAKMAADPTTQKWWAVMMPMQVPLPTRNEGEWWANMEEVFHQE